MTEIIYYDFDELKEKLICSLDAQGKLYFSVAAKKFIDIDKYVCVSIGRKLDDYNIIFLNFHEEEVQGAVKIHNSGNKKYINIKPLFKKFSSKYFDLLKKPKYKLSKPKTLKKTEFQLTFIEDALKQ